VPTKPPPSYSSTQESARKFENEEIRDRVVNFDGHEYRSVKFFNCEIVFGARSVTHASGIEFNNCTWRFEGPAADTVAFMRALYSSGVNGRKLVLDTFRTIAPDLKFRH
jgi:hypothetical protein